MIYLLTKTQKKTKLIFIHRSDSFRYWELSIIKYDKITEPQIYQIHFIVNLPWVSLNDSHFVCVSASVSCGSNFRELHRATATNALNTINLSMLNTAIWKKRPYQIQQSNMSDSGTFHMAWIFLIELLKKKSINCLNVMTDSLLIACQTFREHHDQSSI